MKLLRTIRLDPSDTFVFQCAAEPGEWAVSATFMFGDVDPATLDGKARAGFRGGFLGLPSFGWSTLVQIIEAREQDREALVDILAQYVHEHLGAPGRNEARAAAEQEVAFAASLCEHPQDTLIAVHRTYEDGAIRETFRSLRSRGERKPMRAFSFLEIEGEEESGETVNLVNLSQGERK